MERIGSKTVSRGAAAGRRPRALALPDGSESDRELADVEDAVTVVAHDDEFVYMVRQPREAVGEPALLELPAGKLDVEGESPLECAQRELVEEIGRSRAGVA